MTADGVSLINSSHTTISGATVDNTVSGSLNSTNLNTAYKKLAEQLDQSGVIVGGIAQILLVPEALWKTAIELTDSALVADSANNAINVFRSATGIKVYTSPYLGAANNAGVGTNAGSDTAWFVLTKNHSVSRLIRQELQTALVPWQYSNDNTYTYQANYRESYFVPDYAGIVGSTG